MNDFSDFLDNLRHISKREDFNLRDKVLIANPSTARQVEDKIDMPFGVPAIEPELVEPSKVYMVSRPKIDFPHIDFNFAEVERQVTASICASFGIPSYLFESEPKVYRWQRKSGESIIKWGDRLSDRGLLDNPGFIGNIKSQCSDYPSKRLIF